MKRQKLATRRDLAGFFGIHMMTVTKWERDGMPIADRGRRGKPSLYNITEVRAWLKAREDAAKNGTQLDVTQERARKERTQALLNEQLYKKRDGELLPRDEVIQVWAKQITGARAILLSMPQTFAARIHRAATQEGEAGVERVLHDAINEVLRELADQGRGVKKSTRRPRRRKAIRKKKTTSKKKTSRKK